MSAAFRLRCQTNLLPFDMGDKSFEVADDLGAALEEIAALTNQEASVRTDQVGGGVEPFHIVRTGVGGQFDLQRPELGIDLDQEVKLALVARSQVIGIESPVGVLQRGQYLRDDKPLPTRADPGLTQQRGLVGHI